MPPIFEDRSVLVYGTFNYHTVSFQARNERRKETEICYCATKTTLLNQLLVTSEVCRHNGNVINVFGTIPPK